MYLALIVRDWRRQNMADAFVLVGVGEEDDDPAITAGEVASYIEGLVAYEVQVVYDIADGVPLPLAPATHIELRGPRPLYFRAL